MSIAPSLTALADEARREIGKLEARRGAPCAHTGYGPCDCAEDRERLIGEWRKQLADVEACPGGTWLDLTPEAFNAAPKAADYVQGALFADAVARPEADLFEGELF
jgi:hypothetical protein